MGTRVKQYQLPPTALIPNSPYPLLHYPQLLIHESERSPEKVWDIFSRNDWVPQWIFRYGDNQTSHYHSRTHECMAVLSGSATIKFGVADIFPSKQDISHEIDFGDGDSSDEKDRSGSGIAWDDVKSEEGGVTISAQAGDVFLIPAGVSHKTSNAIPSSSLKLLTPGDAHSIAAKDKRQALADIKLHGFTMLGAYPKDSLEWNFAVGGDDVGHYEDVWAVAKPDLDPVLGQADEGLCGQWK